MQTIDLKGACLSPQQIHLWHWLQEKQQLRVQGAFEITGELKPDVLEQALQQIVDRHEILRTTFTHVPGMELPMQVLGKHIEISCPVVDLGRLSIEVQQGSQEGYWHELLQRPFNLEHGPLLHAIVLHLSSHSHVLILSLHALCADASTLKLLGSAILQAYSVSLHDGGEVEEEDPLQYVNVTAWLNELLQDEAEEQFAYWHKVDLSHLSSIRLPFEGSKEGVHSTENRSAQTLFEQRQITIPLPLTVQQRLKIVSQEREVSVEAVLLAVWQILLWRLTDNPDVLVGMLYDGRPYEELTDLLGPYACTVPIGLSLTESSSFAWVLRQVHQLCQQSREKQLYFTWESVVANEHEPPYFPINFAYEVWSDPVPYDPLTISLLRQEHCLEPSQLQLHVWQSGNVLRMQFMYDVSVFSEGQARHIASMFVQLLNAAIDQPEVPISSLALLTQAQQIEQEERLRGPERAWPFVPLHRLFEEQVRRQPNAAALRCGPVLLSYEQLEQQANQLAHILLQQGLLPGAQVALCLPRDHWTIVGLLAVLKAGGVYVPLDMQMPTVRLRSLLNQLAPDLVLSSQLLQDQLPSLNVPVVCVEELSHQLTNDPCMPPQIEVGPEDLVYVMYTSGSTGVSKGVQIRQRSVSNYTQAMCELLELQAGWHFATVSSLAADLGNTSIFCGLASGGCVHILSYEQITDATAFSVYVEQYPLDVLKIVPTHLQTLLMAGTTGIVPRERLILGGEALSWSLVEQLQQLAPSCQLYNHYGPTEATIGTLVQPLGPIHQIRIPASERRGASVPIGHPLANTQAYLLDERRQWVPNGVVGELYLAGAGLAAGYQSASTQGGFLELDLAGKRQRLYKTGDWVREREPGVLEFVGRRDEQVKLRGYRIEIGEIEAALRQHPQVWDCVVLLQEKGPAGPRLIGYVVARTTSGLTSEVLGETLKQSLPAYMVPSTFVLLEKLPLTSNGKVDRRQLPQPEQVQTRESIMLATPRSPLEDALLTMWQDLLALSVLGIHDNFFAVGGHSLLAMRLIAQIRVILQVELPVKAVFDAPTVAALAQRIEQVLHEDEVLAQPPLVARARPEEVPLSYAQQRLWFLDQLEPGSTTYLVPSALNVRGAVDVQHLEQALQELIRRHESLRTTFEERSGQPVQIVHPARPYTLPVIDLQPLGREQREQEAQRLARQEAQHACDLVQGPLLRVHLLRLESQEHVLLVTLHHIITDGWSNGVFVHELMILYRSQGTGRSFPLAPLAIQYADYALWQREWLQGEILEAHLAYWRTQLAEVPPLEMPTDHRHPAIQSFRGAVQSFLLPAALSEGLVRLSQQEQVTLFMTLLAAFQVLLQRYTGQDDFGVGTPIANRGHAEIEGLIGFFVNTLVLRTDLSGNPTFTQVLQRVRAVCLGAYAHQDVPFEQVVEALAPIRDLSRSPLFQVMLVLQNTPQEHEQDDLAGMLVESLMVESTISKFDLTLSLSETANGLAGTLEYNRDLFEAQTIMRLLGHWQILLEGIVHNPQVCLSELPLLTAEEHELQFVHWNATATWYPQDLCVHQLFEQQVERTPEVVALVFEDETLTYACLNRRANHLAHYLQTLGVGPEVLVGLCLERSIEMVVAVLGILKAGGAYVSLDPSYPQERFAFVVDDADLPLLLTHKEVRARLPIVSCMVVCLEDAEKAIADAPDTPLEFRGHPAHLAYILYTSGSTGQPKGVMVPHTGVVNYLHWARQTYIGSKGYGAPLHSSLSFDLTVTSLFVPLLTGQQVVLLSEDQGVTALASALCNQNSFTLSKVTPSHLDALSSFLSAEPFAEGTQVLILGGEALRHESLFLWQQAAPGTRVFNEYGPTETVVGCCIYEVLPEPSSSGAVPIGKPIANMQAYVLTRHLQPVPSGVSAELYMGGVGVTRGYLNRPDLTAERFIPDPFSTQGGTRLYRTGDLVRSLPDGTLDYIGRMDQQVKIRGYRIELGEIEAILRGHPAIQDTVVLAREDVPGDKRLVAYVVLQPGQTLTVSALRSFLQGRLPAYMLPAHMVVLDVLPLTSNGKVDRKGLPAPDEWEEDEGQLRARTPLEEVVQGLWSTVLGRSQIGIDDNFFEVGGHSLLATQLLARVRATLGREIPLRALFEEPTVAGFARRVEQILRQDDIVSLPPLVAQTHPEEVPLSYAQQRLWFLEQLEPGNTAYLVPNALNIHGVLETQHLQGALHELIDRHESLRTTFEERAGQPVQVIHPTRPYTLPVIDLLLLGQEQREREAYRLASQEAQNPCDLVCGPLLRTSLLRLEKQVHVLLLTLHHIITDGWSNGVLVQELMTLYRSFEAGQPSPLEALPLQYADYVLWQRGWLQGEVLEAHLAYWRAHLAQVPLLEMPTDHPRPPVQAFRGAIQLLQLSAPMSKALEALSQQEHVTLFMTLLAAFQVLLQRYTGQDDFGVGTPIANRGHAEIEGLIGFFVNTLVLRTDLSGNPTFTQLLQRVREVCLGAYAHQDVPFEQVVEALAPTRDLSRSPLFQVMLVLQNIPQAHEPDDLAGIRVESLQVESTVSKFDLTLSLSETEDGLAGTLEYNCDLFEAETITRLLGHWQTVLEGIVQHPQAHLWELPLLTAEEYTLQMEHWNATRREYPQDRCVHQLFEEQVQRTPEAVALLFEDETLTYACLNRRANQLAHHLQTLGVGPDILVGIGLERCIEMVLALLAVLKAGGGYVPLDPQYPEERLAFLIADAHIQLLLTQQRFHALFASSAVPQVWLDTLSEALTHLSDDPVESSVGMDHLAYVIYTSGSTGRPKGVMISHRALGNHMRWMHDTFPLLPQERLLQKTSFSFDASVWEIYAPLLCGASLILATPEGPRDSRYLIQVLQEQAITRLQLVPSQLRVLLEEPDFAHGPILQHVFCGGEALSTDLATRFFAAGSGHLHNLYGPTETTIDAICWQCHPEETGAWPPIGRPIANIQTYILDTACRPVPAGVVGELYLAGVGLARGYLGRPDLTAEKFLPHPFAHDEGSRLYKTGDQARYRANGVIEYLGRMDQQVKIRGHRIELGEIEAALRELPVVQDAVALVREEVPGDQRLVAYVVLHAEQTLTMSALRSSLQDRLPAYMLPTHMVVLDTLPLTSNGKIDRKALPAPNEWVGEEDAGQQRDRTPMEEVIEGLWSTVLGRSQIGIHDNFFEVGGHSLLATQLLARVRTTLGVEIPLRTIFEEPTIASFARRVEHALHQNDVSLPPLVAQTRPEVIPLSYAQQRLWFLEQLEPGGTTYLLPSALNVRGEIDLSSLEQAFEELIGRHESLRTTFEERAGQPVQVIHPTYSYTLPVIDLHLLGQKQREQEARQLASQEAQRPCDLIKGPLLRTSLLRLEKQEHVLLLTLHHIITDGWSNGILVHELTSLYRSLGAGQPSALAPLPIQYADYALWQRGWLQGEILDAHLAYWRTHLAQVPALELPTDHPRPAVQTSRGVVQSLHLSGAVLDALGMLSRQEHVTLFMTLLAAFQVLLQRYSGQDDFSVGTPIANRGHAEIEGLIGFFVNTLVLRSDLSGNPTFTEVLQRVREVCLGAYAHQDVPFEQVVEALAPTRDLSRSPLFQVMLILQNTPQEQGQDDLAGMRVTSLLVESTISKFDLTLSVAETGQGLHCTLEYNTDLFEAHTITRLLGHWQTLLEGIVQHPQAHLSDLPLLTAEEHTLLLTYWNATATWYPQDLCVHQLFEQQVQRTPDAVALLFRDETLTYACLNRGVNQLAHYLQTLGVGPEVLVGICLERSIEMVVALLAILKAGGAYVPLDPSYPQDRLAFIVADAQVALLLTSHLPDALGAVTQSIQSIDLGRERHAIAAQRSVNPHGPVSAENLAYVIYTSGSTGKPKGTMVLHRNVSNFFTAMDDRLGAQETGIWLAVTSISFDISVLELLWTLARGFQVVVRPSLQETTVTHDPDRSQEEAFAAQIQRQGITHLQCTPSQASLLLAEPEFLPSLGCLRMWLLGGEALPAALLTQIEQGFAGTIHNMYGPTETTIWSLTHKMQKSDPTVVIGRPIANTQVYLLDPNGHCVPIGVAGELFLGGKGVVRGYLNRADLTAEKFLPDPWSAEAGACLYRTGDLARYRLDGTIEYLGRIDQQVKIRGYRIELGEIETVLREQPGVREAVVQVRDDGRGQKWLVAYVVSAEEITAAALRRGLHEKLPAPMVPARFQRLDALPLTPNGKVDRKRLPAPEEWEGEEDPGQQRSRTPLEEVVQGLWSTVLGRTQIGIDDNFFELGGHSLLATQLLGRVRTTLGVEIPLRAIFEEPTVAGFARRVEQALHLGQVLPLPPLEVGTRSEEIPLSYAQQRLWFLEQLEPESTAYLLSDALSVNGRLETQHLERAFEELISRHESLRTTFAERAGEPIQVIHPTGRSPLLVIDLQALVFEQRAEEARRLASQEAQRPCNLVQGPLLRTSLLRLEPEAHILLLTLHHIITDGWSNGVFVRELTTLYRSSVAGQLSPLAPLPIQYADYALWQRGWLHGEVLDTHLTYWREHLAGVTPLKLPTDVPHGAKPSNRGASSSFRLPPELTEELMKVSRQEGVTLFMLLLATFQVLLYRLSGEEDIVVGTDVANRNHVEIEGLIGFFVNQLVLRSHVVGYQTFRKFLHQVRNMTLDAYLHQDVPFEKLVEVLQPERDGQATPFFTVKMLLQSLSPEGSFSQETNDLSDISVASFTLPAERAVEVDLILRFVQTSEGIQAMFDYRRDLFEEATIARMARHFLTLLKSSSTNQDELINGLEMLSMQEKQETEMNRKERETALSTKLKSIHPRPVSLQQE